MYNHLMKHHKSIKLHILTKKGTSNQTTKEYNVVKLTMISLVKSAFNSLDMLLSANAYYQISKKSTLTPKVSIIKTESAHK